MTDRELEQIYNEAYKAVYWTAMALLKNEADAEDIVQDTFVSLIESYDSIKDKSKVISWLKKTAANKCLNRLTRTKTDNMEDEFFDSVEAVPEDFLPDSIVESEDTRKVIMDIINRSLSEDIRRTLILFYFDEMSTKEIAEALGIPQGTVLWRLNSAKKKIKKEVEKYEEDNNTKLYGMAIPFLSKLFMKEAEQVAFKPIPAKLVNLSASRSASLKEAGKTASKEALRKGTDIMKTKILAGTIAGVVAVGIVVGIVIGVLSKKADKNDEQPDTTIEEYNGNTLPDDYVLSAGNAEPEDTDDSEETEETEATRAQNITEDSIFITMDGMTSDEVVENLWKTANVEVGLTKDSYAERFILPDEDTIQTTDNNMYWQFHDWSDSEAYISQLDIIAGYDKDTLTLSGFNYTSGIAIMTHFEVEAFANEVLDKIAKKYESMGYVILSDEVHDEVMEGYRRIEVEGNGITFTVGITPVMGYSIEVFVPIVEE